MAKVPIHSSRALSRFKSPIFKFINYVILFNIFKTGVILTVLSLLVSVECITNTKPSKHFTATYEGTGAGDDRTGGGEIESSPNCGVLDYAVDDSRVLHPWVVGIFRKTSDFSNPFRFLVGGTIIGPSTVLSIYGGAYGSTLRTGAQGKIKYGPRLPRPQDFFVVAGLNSTDLGNADEINTQIREVEYMLPYNDENPHNKEYQLFILHLKTPFDFKSPFVNSICLPSTILDPNTNQDLEFVNGFPEDRIIFVTGFEFSQKPVKKTRVQLMKLGTKTECRKAFSYYYKADGSHILCAKPAPGYMDEHCISHGSGLAFLIRGKYYLGGVVALIPSRRLNACTINSIFFFSSLTFEEEKKHLVWMLQNVACSPQFPCSNGSCLPLTKLCDHYNDCPGPVANTFVNDFSVLSSDDEESLFCELVNYCPINNQNRTYSCGFKDNSCISSNQLCDGNSDCQNGYDEADGICGRKTTTNNATDSKLYMNTKTNTKWEDSSRDRIVLDRNDNAVKCPPLLFSHQQGINQVCSHRGVMVACDNANPGTSVTLSCKPFYRSKFRQNSIEMTCGEEGRWKPFRSFACDAECGKLDVDRATGFIANGIETVLVGFPWYAAIFILVESTGQYTFSCGASLVETSVIITAAHCLPERHGDVEYLKKKYKIVLAAFSSHFELNTPQNGAVVTSIDQLWIPPTFDPVTLRSDIAILHLTQQIQYSSKIRPVCYLPQRTGNALPAAGSLGKVSGFGRDETGKVSEKLKWANFPVVSNEVCSRALNVELNGNEFCAGFRNGTNVCEGDSGGGMVFSKHTNSQRPTYILKGVVSRGVATQDGKCDTRNLAIFTFLDSFNDWIFDVLETFDDS